MKETSSNEAKPKDLRELEDVIEGGLLSFLDIGYALLEIKDRQLYSAQSPTFEFYCLSRWKPSRAYLQRHLDAAMATHQLFRDLPENGALARLEPRDAMELAHLSLFPLFQIREEDPDRDEALLKVKSWIDRQLRQQPVRRRA